MFSRELPPPHNPENFHLGKCPVCEGLLAARVNIMLGETVCPHCHEPLWFLQFVDLIKFFPEDQTRHIKQRVTQFWEDKLQKPREVIVNCPDILATSEIDSMSVVEMVMDSKKALKTTSPLERITRHCSIGDRDVNDSDALSKQDRSAARLLAAREVTLGPCTNTIYQFAGNLLNKGYYHDDLLAIIDARPTSNTNVLSEFHNFCQKHDILFANHEQATWYLVRYHMGRMAQQDSSPEQELGALFREFCDGWYEHLEGPTFEKYDLGELIGLTMYYQDEVADEIRKAAGEWLARHGANAE